MKELINKLSTNTSDGTVNKRTLPFSNTAIEKYLPTFGNLRHKSIPFKVPLRSHLKGLTFRVSNVTKKNQVTEYQVTKNHKEIVENKQRELQIKISLEDERARKADPSFYGRMLTGPIPPVITHRTPWKDVYPKEPDEYDRYTQEHLRDEKKFEYY